MEAKSGTARGQLERLIGVPNADDRCVERNNEPALWAFIHRSKSAKRIVLFMLVSKRLYTSSVQVLRHHASTHRLAPGKSTYSSCPRWT